MNSTDVRRQWADRAGEFSPEYYAYYGPNETSEAVRELCLDHVGRDATVLEVGCSSGRHLAHLLEDGFGDLSGIELNDHAFEVMAETYPELATAGSFHAAAIEDVVETFEDDQFDAVYSVQTLQHVHPDAAWVFDELARITDDLLVTVESETPNDGYQCQSEATGENEHGRTDSTSHDVSYVNDDFPLYYRDWQAIFGSRGFTEVESQPTRRATLRAFRLAPDDSSGA